MARFLFGFFLLLTSLQPLSVFAQTDDLTGLWQSEGYGYVFDIQPDHITVYQATAASCVTFLTGSEVTQYEPDAVTALASIEGILGLIIGEDTFLLEFSREGEQLHFDGVGIAPIVANRIEQLPSVCEDATLNAGDPETVFEAFWNLYNEQYAFFDLHGVPWQFLYTQYRPLVTPETTDEALFQIMVEMITPLEDEHTALLADPSMLFLGGIPPEWSNGGDEETLMAYLGVVAENYLNEEYQETANGLIQYGRLSETVGYINLMGMTGFAEDADQEPAALATAMDEVLAALADVDVMVVDIRFNGGGDDAYSLYIAGRFAEERILAFTKQARMGDSLTDPFEAYVEPTGDAPFTGQVYLLTSGISVSAAETFTLAMTALPTVTTVGETTAGAFSDILFGQLANGWLMGLSNEVYTSHDGIIYEGVGIPPEIAIPMSAEEMQAGRDPILEAVLEQVGQ